MMTRLDFKGSGNELRCKVGDLMVHQTSGFKGVVKEQAANFTLENLCGEKKEFPADELALIEDDAPERADSQWTALRARIIDGR